MIVLVDLKEGVSPKDYESWVRDSYAPVAKALPSVRDWRGYRVGGLLVSDALPPHQYVVIVEVDDMEHLERDMVDEDMQRLLSELHAFAEVTQLSSERFV